MRFDPPVTHVYNPLDYAAAGNAAYLSLARSTTEVLFLGMNPGPWGMAQTGVPFGEIAAVNDFIGIHPAIDRPDNEHPKRPIVGMACTRSEVSGRRLWGLFADRFENAAEFFKHHFVINYCPLVFMESSGRNHTPDKLPAATRRQLDQICDEHLIEVIDTLSPRHLIGVGVYAEKCFRRVLPKLSIDPPFVDRVLHPSPASPAANRDWAGKATRSLVDAGVWPSDLPAD